MQVFPRMAIPEESLVCHLQSAPTRGLPAGDPSLHSFGGTGRPSFQGHIPTPVELGTVSGFPLSPSKGRAAEMHPAGTEPPGAAAAVQGEDLGRVLSSVTGSLWQEWTSASRRWDTSLAATEVWHADCSASTSSQDEQGSALLGHLRGFLERKVSKNSHRDQTQFFKDSLLILFCFVRRN